MEKSEQLLDGFFSNCSMESRVPDQGDIHMKHILPILIVSLFIQILSAFEGEAYQKVDKATHKIYAVNQKHGKNVLKLDEIVTCFYDSEGNIVEKYIMQGNRSYKGKMVKNIRKDPFTIEILDYNHMNLLISRRVEYLDSVTGEGSAIDYDAKGKILKKTSTRLSSVDPDLWEFNYNQVGYAATYARIMRDGLNVSQRLVYDYKDDLLETHDYSYDDNGLPIKIIAKSPSDSTLFRKEFTYDDFGNILEEITYDSQDNPTQSIVSVYDDDQRLIQRSEFIWNPRFGRIPNLLRQTDVTYE